MFERRSLKLPITLGVAMIVLVVLLTIGWIFVTIFAARKETPAAVFWALLAVGTVLLICVLGGVITYLTLSVKAINLNRRQSNFIDSVTHELKSPIASLKLYLQTLTLRDVDEKQRQDFHRFMLADVERLDQLINHLLDTGRIEKGSLSNEEEEFQLEDLLQRCAEVACIRYHLPPETVRLEVPPIPMLTKQIQLEIVFRNLLDNAFKYGGVPPEVIVTARTVDPDLVEVRVIDNGKGIPVNQRRKVFGRFVRLGSELERSRQGTGLGLYLVRNIVRKLGGAVRVHGRKDSSGTEFEVVLPGVVTSLTPATVSDNERDD
ncbi:Alkaline phosphatase synthesis sensor protein PhoR [Roseimaritima multifibrata]|uniref:histidine kinase n=1 Tax=Roseimaritima multifibrata TaxID=1930274 RepID=A0A517MKL7_9BACT|nr:HAMP domain-containing sensor histidine kinase [Roseimaritima multifibrata]QDS95435.1 Alkaline phosphatase synthesis sensor protein PhoR [Roseimaritima multifibrata]